MTGEREPLGFDLLLRRVPRHHWVRVFAQWDRSFEPGHSWLYYGCLRRDAWRVGALGFGVMRMPKERSRG